jgi:hypothetical protein
MATGNNNIGLSRSEADIQKQIVSYLSHTASRFNNFTFFSIPNEGFLLGANNRLGEVEKARKLKYLKTLGLTPGMPDIEIVTKDGRAFFLEIKSEKGRLNENQKLVHRKLHNLNIQVEVVRSVEEVMELIKRWGI